MSFELVYLTSIFKPKNYLKSQENLKEDSCLSCGKYHSRLVLPDLRLNNVDVKATV